LNKFLHPLHGYPAAAAAFTGALFRCGRALGLNHRPLGNVDIPEDFFGVNIAPGESDQTNDYLLQRLAELGVTQVRMDYSYNSPGNAAQGLLDRLLAQGYGVFLNAFPPLDEARILHRDADAQGRWSHFLQRLFAEYGQKVACFEIGNTPNRGRWSGFSSRSFLMAWHLAGAQARGQGVTLAGPNVSDFEPLYNATYLSLISRVATAPDIHTDNLFVERVVEPEAYDHRVMGRLATPLLKLNLIKKARLLQAIGAETGSQDLVCTYTCWTSKRLARRNAWPDQKQVDYLVRYYTLAICSGALQRVYWGPLVCHRDGLIDDGCDDYPAIDQVSFYQSVRGSPDQFRQTPAFSALAQCAGRLAGATCTAAVHDPSGVSLFAFQSSQGGYFLLGWCRDGMACPLDLVLPERDLEQASFSNALGEAIPRPLSLIEQPIYIDLSGSVAIDLPPSLPGKNTSHLCAPLWQSADFRDKDWIGACMLRRDEQLQDRSRYEALHPTRVMGLPEGRVLRDVRNRLWNVADPRGFTEQVTVKLNRVKGLKKITYRFRPSKGRRHWNNAVQMLRRDVPTPLPVAFYEQRVKPGVRDSWYICEFVPDAFSARDVYAAFRDGAQSFHALDKLSWFNLLSKFICHMHNKQVVHRDLSAGNLMLHLDGSGNVIPQVIDIGRAWIWLGPGSRIRDRHRLQDLIRICYKLDWQDRNVFIELYESHMGKSLSLFWRIPFLYYDSKQAIKKAVKGKRKKRPAPGKQ
jgi:hypothetical protein